MSEQTSAKQCHHAWKMESDHRRACTKCRCVDVILWEPESPISRAALKEQK